MDFLEFFKGNIHFLDLNNSKPPLISASRTGSPDRGCGRDPCGPRGGWPATGQPHGILRRPVRLGSKWAGVWPGR
jgi:hypothetical protein